MSRLARPLPTLGVLVAALVALALTRGLDHDESQYVAAARLVADGLLPYRDFAYLQTPLQPFVFAAVAWAFGGSALAALRVVNALLGAVVVAASWRAMRVAGVDTRTAALCAGLLATCDILLFAAGTARNDALPAALLSLALAPMLRAERGAGSRGGAVLIGLLLAGAAAAKISYAVPAAAYGAYALAVRWHRPGWVALGAVLPVAFVAWSASLAPDAFVFGTLTFPAEAPAEYYRATGRAWKLSAWAKTLDVVKFLALGPALLAVVTLAKLAPLPGREGLGVGRSQQAGTLGEAHPPPTPPFQGGEKLLIMLTLAGLVAALIPSPTWRQYLLPALPPLFVALALRWSALPPTRGWRIVAAAFVVAGLAPSLAATRGGGVSEATAAAHRLAGLSLFGPVATLSPQVLPRDAPPDPRFAAGPFYFRSRALLSPADESRFHLVSRDRLDALLADPPTFVLVGGEGAWTAGDAALDRALEAWATRNGWRAAARVGPHLRLYARNRVAARPSSAAR